MLQLWARHAFGLTTQSPGSKSAQALRSEHGRATASRQNVGAEERMSCVPEETAAGDGGGGDDAVGIGGGGGDTSDSASYTGGGGGEGKASSVCGHTQHSQRNSAHRMWNLQPHRGRRAKPSPALFTHSQCQLE